VLVFSRADIACRARGLRARRGHPGRRRRRRAVNDRLAGRRRRNRRGGLLFAQEQPNRVSKLGASDRPSIYLEGTHGAGLARHRRAGPRDRCRADVHRSRATGARCVRRATSVTMLARRGRSGRTRSPAARSKTQL